MIFSGLNNLAIYLMSRHYSKELGSFFFSNRFHQAMKTASMSRKRRFAETILKPIRHNKSEELFGDADYHLATVAKEIGL